MKYALAFLGAFLLSTSAWANVRLPALVGDNMVLQRDANINLWGWADPAEKVTVQFQGRQLSTSAGADGKWKLVLPPVPAGGPYDLVVAGKNTLTLHNVLVGEVWLASGQSNMEWPLNGINNAGTEVETAEFPQIRLFTAKTAVALQPQARLKSPGWQVCTPQTVAAFSAVAFLFGHELHQRYKVPVGLIQSAWGGTPVQSWTSAEGLKPFPEFSTALARFSQTDSSAFAAFTARKEAWYQQFGKVDRGHSPNSPSWASADVNTASWPTLAQPVLWSTVSQLKGFTGIVWLRKTLTVPAASAGKPLELNLGRILVSDSTFFNGQFVGRTVGAEKARRYQVPGNLVQAGENTVAVRVVGNLFFGGGLGGAAADLYAQAGPTRLPLAGEWRYQTGPDLTTMPYEAGLSEVNSQLPQSPAIIYNAMIAPLLPYTMKGVIWYQGESNADDRAEALRYYQLFPALITDWRRQWGTDFPFLFVQLAGYQPNPPAPADEPWARLREAQARALALPATGMATAIDVGEETNIHPKNKQPVAHRLALAAEKVAYRENVVASGPTFKSLTVEGTKVRLRFANTGTGLLPTDSQQLTHCFAVAGADKKFVWATAVVQGNDIVVSAPGVPQPMAVRYNWVNTPQGNFYNKENLPAVPFRTDNW
ncbi:sialate O-acetylesterase [Hymenobacter monticola]|uniref:Sialate O-acetylesterase n=1 Tax=Hymenobacter monticola TaxID=1705399 RepID=A0ABY4BF49_9BACT|nr:sialate O-acetylesterase [Hymenobacter monticola]UOE36403.1 sialate O-acetylesterase [Hymenobacter monticola]